MRHAILAQGPHDLGHLARHMTDLMHKVIQSGFSPQGKHADWVPAVDICETCDAYEIIVELAGVRREDIEVFTENRHVTVAGWREDPAPRDKMRLHQIEIEQGQFRRRILLPANVDEESISARYRDGILRVRIPKRLSAAP
jgi:HSP20 family protein